jgi:hypothetical protein
MGPFCSGLAESLPRTPEPRAFLARVMPCLHHPSSARTCHAGPLLLARCHAASFAPALPSLRAAHAFESALRANTTRSRVPLLPRATCSSAANIVPALLCRARVRPALQRLGPLASAPSAPICRRVASRPRSARLHPPAALQLPRPTCTCLPLSRVRAQRRAIQGPPARAARRP